MVLNFTSYPGTMDLMAFSFRLIATDGAARAGEMTTAHGLVHTPCFMPVGTQAAVKGVHHDDVRAAGTELLLANTYHLMLRPGAERVARSADCTISCAGPIRSSPIPAAFR